MQYTVVHSKDPYLLARLATDLQMEGIETTNNYWCQVYNPFSHDEIWMPIYPYKVFEFHPHACKYKDEVRYELTSSNYIKVLTQILEP